MANETYKIPSYERTEQIIREAQLMRAEALRAGFRAVAAWIAHPVFRPHHA